MKRPKHLDPPAYLSPSPPVPEPEPVKPTAAPAGGAVVRLSRSGNGIYVPEYVIVPAGVVIELRLVLVGAGH